MITEIAKKIYKINEKNNHNVSNVYLLNFDTPILIDVGDEYFEDENHKIINRRESIINDLETIMPIKNIKQIFLTHLHHDHIENLSVFENAKIYISKKALADYKEYATFCFYGYSDNMYDRLENIQDKIKVLPKQMSGLDVIETPGHTNGSVCFYEPKNKILFSGDHVFDKNYLILGRADFPNSNKKEYSISIEKTKKLDVEILCPGHDYAKDYN